ncbi:MAG: 4a-hydroxytetrahydrobiopterin dehydratase [Patescibacteria group bacterium]
MNQIINDLTTKKCVACEGGVPPLTPDEVEVYQKKFAEPWEVVAHMRLKKIFKFPDFKKALDFVDKVGFLAEEEGHHPDVYLSYGQAVIELTTHAIKGLSENDFILAAKIDGLGVSD